MILREELIEIGRFLKPHGISGEIAFSCDYEDLDLKELRCVVAEMDGIPVPFFIHSVRPKGRDTLIVKIDGLDNEKAVAMLSNRPAYALKEDVDVDDEIGKDESQLTAYDLEGFVMIDDDSGRVLGTIDYIDDTTQNWLFMVNRDSDEDAGRLLAVPVADEFIAQTDLKNKQLRVKLPEGLLEL